MHPDLRFAGLLNPLDMPHHMRATEAAPFREGVVVAKPGRAAEGCFVNVGLLRVRLRPAMRRRVLIACTVLCRPVRRRLSTDSCSQACA